jgi:hypothetical protein
LSLLVPCALQYIPIWEYVKHYFYSFGPQPDEDLDS